MWRRRRQTDDDFRAEIRAHLTLETDRGIADGLPPSEARHAAHRAFGNVTHAEERFYESRRVLWLDDLVRDLGYGVRRLLGAPLVTLTAVTALALGIGATTAVFTIVTAVLFQSVPVDQPDRVVWLESRDARGRPLGLSRQDFEDWRRESRTLSAMALAFNPGLSLSGDDRLPAMYPGIYMSAAGFTAIRATAALGRVFSDADDRPGAPAVVVIAGSIWKGRYGGDPGIIGRPITVNTIPATVIGVMPDGFAFPVNAQIWLPMSQLPSLLERRGRGQRFYFGLGRLADGVTLAQAQSELTNLSRELAGAHADTNADISAAVTPFLARTVDPQIRTLSHVLLAAVAFVLLIACSNVANLLMARASTRAREMTVRRSLGATRWRLVRQLMVETALLAGIGGLLGLGLAELGVRWFDSTMETVGRPYWMTFTIGPPTFGVFAAVVLTTAVLFGLGPALRLSKQAAVDTLKDGGYATTSGPSSRRWIGGLVVAQLALTLVLLSGAALMMRSFVALTRTSVGVDTSRLLTMRIVLPGRKYTSFDALMSFMERVEERLNAVPGVDAASTATALPLQGVDERQIEFEGRAPRDETAATAVLTSVGPRYFDTLGLAALRGRTMTALDGAPGHEVAVINERMATLHFAGEDPIGERLRLVDVAGATTRSAWATVVGVVPNVRQRRPQDAPEADPVVYIPNLQHLTHRYGTMILVRTRGTPGSYATAMREAVFALDPDLPLTNVETMDQVLANERWPSRVFGIMFAVFAAAAILLAGIGLHAMTAYSVAERTTEIGIRLALGARGPQILWLVGRRVVLQLIVGLVAGMAGAVVLGKLLTNVLFATAPTDPTVLMLVAAILVSAAIVACAWPVRRALGLDPVIALRAN